jgi:hypothetical protein
MLLRRDELEFPAMPVFVNRTRRFILPLLADDSAPLLIGPAGSKKAGKPLRKDPNARGLVVLNDTDGAVQGVKSDGTESLCINDITPEQATAVRRFVMKDGRFGSIELVAATMAFARDAFQHTDFFPKDLDGLLNEHKLVGPEFAVYGCGGEVVGSCGYFESTKQTRHRAIAVTRAFCFRDGPTDQDYGEEGAVLVDDGRYAWGVANGPFLRNFRRLEGTQEIALRSIMDEVGLVLR